jgi:hypothetical protein
MSQKIEWNCKLDERHGLKCNFTKLKMNFHLNSRLEHNLPKTEGADSKLARMNQSFHLNSGARFQFF